MKLPHLLIHLLYHRAVQTKPLPLLPDLLPHHILRQHSEDCYGESSGQTALKMEVMDEEWIPLEVLSSVERKGVSMLAQHALVTVDGKGLGAMHALTQAVVREQLVDKAERLGLATAVVDALEEKLYKFHYMNPATHFIGRRYGRHAMALVGHAREWGLVPGQQGDAVRRRGRGGMAGERREAALLVSVRSMCTQAGTFFDIVGGQYGQAQGLYEMGLACAVARYGYAHNLTAASYGHLGNVYFKRDKQEEAEGALRKALEIQLKVFGPQHPDVAATYMNLGACHNYQGKLKEALRAYRKSLAINLKVLGPEHPEVAMCWGNCGNIYDSQGKSEEALKAHSKALEIQLKALGPMHPDVASSYNNMGLVYESQGKFEEALQYFRQSLQIKHKVYGDVHPDTANTTHNIGMALQATGKTSEAEAMFAQAAATRRLLLGPDHHLTTDAECCAE